MEDQTADRPTTDHEGITLTNMKTLFNLHEEVHNARRAERQHRLKHPFDVKGRRNIVHHRQTVTLAYNDTAFKALRDTYGIEPHSVKVQKRHINWRKDAMTNVTAVVDGYQMNLVLGAHGGKMVAITEDGEALVAIR